MKGRCDSVAEATDVLARCLPGARLVRIPRHPQHRDLVLAILCGSLQRRYPYTEPELNQALGAGLAAMDAAVDHVTARRYMVDCGFVKRDRAGQRYLLNFGRLDETVSAEVAEAAADIVAAALERQRQRLARSARPPPGMEKK